MKLSSIHAAQSKMSWTLLFFSCLGFLSSWEKVHAQTEDGSRNPLDMSQTGTRLAIQTGCAAVVIHENNAYHQFCHDQDPITIYPHTDGIYRISIYTGFPPDSSATMSRPTHGQYYKFWRIKDLYIGDDGCLRPSGWDRFWSELRILEAGTSGWDALWDGYKRSGQCPPDEYPLAAPELINPYKRKDFSSTFAPARDEGNSGGGLQASIDNVPSFAGSYPDSIVGGDDDHDESQQQTGEEVYERDIHSFSDSKGAGHGSGVF